MTGFIKHVPQDVDPENPWHDDLLRRSELADELTRFLSTIRQPFVFGLQAGYGNGKTFFVKRWIANLRGSGLNAVYFNAWSTDYADNPLLAFTTAIGGCLDEIAGQDLKETTKDLGKFAARIALGVAPRALSFLTANLLQPKDIENLPKKLQHICDSVEDISGTMSEELIKQFQGVEDAVFSFKEKLREVAASLPRQEETSGKLVIFVDELDRCRPDYAVNVLESIKHFFDVDNVIFVISYNRGALEDSVKALFGQGIDVDSYLRKFFDYSIEMNKPPYNEFMRKIIHQQRMVDVIEERNFEDWVNLSICLFSNLLFPLRKTEQVASEINFLIRSSANRNDRLQHFLYLIVCALYHSGETEVFTTQRNPSFYIGGLNKIYKDWQKDEQQERLLHACILAGFCDQRSLIDRVNAPNLGRRNPTKEDRFCALALEFQMNDNTGKGLEILARIQNGPMVTTSI